jgi:outer membrane protein assembly factor BamB
MGILALCCLARPVRAEMPHLPQLWEVGTGTSVDSCPAIDQNGTVYLTASGNVRNSDVSGGRLVAITSQGVKKWEFKTFSEIKSSPALGIDGTIYFGSRDRKFYALNPDGKAKWSFSTGDWVDSSSAIGANGVVYFGGWDHRFYALKPDGTKQWEFVSGGPIDSSPAIAADGTIYFGSHDKNFYALNPDGSKKWVFATGGAIISSPALNADGLIYFTSVDGKLYALNSDGSEKWHSWTGGSGESSPVIDGQGTIYLGVNDEFCALKPGGAQKWYFGYPKVEGSAAIAADGTVYVGGLNSGVGILFAFNSEGQVWSYTPVGGQAASSPTIGDDGTVYYGSYVHPFCAFKGKAPLAKSPWPKFRGNLGQTGRLSPAQ